MNWRTVVIIWIISFSVVGLLLTLAGCNSTAANARDSIAAFHGYLVSAQEKHTLECIEHQGRFQVCDTLRRADAAQDAAVHALEAYCQFPPQTLVVQVQSPLGSATTNSQSCKPVSSLQGGLAAALSSMNALTSDIKQAAQ